MIIEQDEDVEQRLTEDNVIVVNNKGAKCQHTCFLPNGVVYFLHTDGLSYPHQ